MQRFLLSLARLLAVTEQTLVDTAEKVNEVIGEMIGPVLIALGGAGAIYMIIIGVQYAKSEDEKGRAETMKRLINCLIGVLIIITLAVLCMAIKWDQLIPSLFGYLEETPTT